MNKRWDRVYQRIWINKEYDNDPRDLMSLAVQTSLVSNSRCSQGRSFVEAQGS